MTTIKSIPVLILLITSLFKANSLGFINSQSLEKILNELYFQPYPEFSKQALYHRFPDFDQTRINTDCDTDKHGCKIAIQIGHLLEEELPLELIYLGKTGGAQVQRLKEVEINKSVAGKLKNLLASRGYQVELLNALIPAAYSSDVFVALHANYDKENVSGFMIGIPLIDYSQKSGILRNIIIEEYKKSTSMKFIDYQSSNMTQYYSFNWSRFKRAIHPKTPAVIIEMGNLKNLNDLITLTIYQDKVAEGIANGIIRFLNESIKLPIKE